MQLYFKPLRLVWFYLVHWYTNCLCTGDMYLKLTIKQEKLYKYNYRSQYGNKLRINLCYAPMKII